MKRKELHLYATVMLKVSVPADMDEDEVVDEVGSNFDYDFSPPDDSDIELIETEWLETRDGLD